MATRQQVQYAYGISQEIITLAPLPIVAQRAPTSNDFEQPGQTWIDKPNNRIYFLSSVTANVANWQLLTASGGPGSFSSLTVNPGNITVTAGNVVITAGNLSATAIVSPAALTVTPTTNFTLNVGAGSTLALSNTDTATITNISTGGATANKIVTIGSLSGSSPMTLRTGTGGLNVTSGGIFTLQAAVDTQASPSATAVINANVGSATFTGFTTAAAATQVFTVTNSLVTATSQIICSVTNAGANDAQMTITRINPGAGTFDVTLVNNGAAALNGNVVITFMVIG